MLDATAMKEKRMEIYRKRKLHTVGVKPRTVNQPYHYPIHVCGNCEVVLRGDMKYCYNCGNKIDWSI